MPDTLSDILESPDHTILASDWGSTEGPVWHPGGARRGSVIVVSDSAVTLHYR